MVNRWPYSQTCIECVHGELVMSDTEACMTVCNASCKAGSPECRKAYAFRDADPDTPTVGPAG